MMFDDIVSSYITNYRPRARAEAISFKKEPDLVTAIRRAALCLLPNGKRHPHQYRISRSTLENAERCLQSSRDSLIEVKDFEAIYKLVGDEIGGIKGIGALTVYDIAHRLGFYLGKAPTKVYLHAGAKAGASILGFGGNVVFPEKLPAAFSRLTPAEIEDCLCIYKNELQTIAKSDKVS